MTEMEYEESELPLDGEPNPTAIVETFDDMPGTSDFEYSCEVCGVEIFYGGRGRKPKRCAAHKKGGAKPASVSRSGTAGKWQSALGEALQNQFIMIGVAVYPFENFDGQVIINGSPALASSLVAVAETNPVVRDALQKFVAVGAWSQVSVAVANIAIPILMHHNVIPAIKIPGMSPGV